MKKLNKTEVKELILKIKQQSLLQSIKANVYRAIKEFILKYQEHIYEYNNLYFIGNNWVYDITNLMNIEPLPENGKILFCGFCDSNDDIYHYWLKDKKTLLKYGITYQDYKKFESLNWFITHDEKLYINNRYYVLKSEV